jgi:midasin
LLGQFRPEGASFRWVDGELLTAVKEGGTLALVDLNLAQQQVVEGINSLFDYRGSIYVVDIGQTYRKAPSFRPVVVLKTKVEGDRKMLPNSFLNRFVKLHIRQFSHLQKIAYLRKHYHGIDDEVVGKLTTYLEMLNGTPFEPQLIQLELFCSVLLKSGCLKQALRVAFIRPFGY